MPSLEKTPAVLYLLIYGTTAEKTSERQELFTSHKRGKRRASELVKLWSSKPNSVQSGSVRSGEVLITVGDETYFVRLSEVVDPHSRKMLWRMWKQAEGDAHE